MAPFSPAIPSVIVAPIKQSSTWALDIFPEGFNYGKFFPSYILIMCYDIFSKLIYGNWVLPMIRVFWYIIIS